MVPALQRLGKIPGALFLLAFVVFLVASNVRMAFNSLALYELGFSRHDVARTTGLTPAQLSEAGQQIRDYFNSSDEPLDVRVTDGSTTRPLYGQREIIHMRDVKDLVQRVYRVQEAVSLYLFLFITLGFFTQGNDFGGRVRRLLMHGSALTVALVAVAALLSLLAFGPLFVLFHELSFSNDFWQLDPANSYLVQMFPQGFWMETTILIGVASVVEAAAIVVLLTLIRWWRQWRQRVAHSKAPQFI